MKEALVTRREEFEASRRGFNQNAEVVTLLSTPAGDVVAVYLEGEDPVEGNRKFAASDAPFDSWFRGELKKLFPPEIDFDQPVCVMFMAVLHFVGPDDDPEHLVATYRNALAPGSWLAISQMSEGDGAGEALEGLRWFVEQYRKTSNPVWLRSREEIEPLFGDWKLLEPGITHLPDWRPDRTLNPLEAEARPFAWCGIAEKA